MFQPLRLLQKKLLTRTLNLDVCKFQYAIKSTA